MSSIADTLSELHDFITGDLLTSPPASPSQATQEIELTIVMPCLSESETLGICIRKAFGFLSQHDVRGEVVIADNGSMDGSREIAREHGARVIDVEGKGYGNALAGGIGAALGKFVVMGDADDSYDFSNLMPFLERLREGDDLVMGNRFRGGILPGAMPWKHRYLGNPILTGIGLLFFHSRSRDFHCGLRGFRKDAYAKMNLRTTGMEFASEMVIKATLAGLVVTEVPTTLSPDGRSTPPHLRSWRDGWRHLRFMLLYSPRWLFFYPGVLMIAIGLFTAGLLLATGGIVIWGVGFGIHTLLYATMAVVIGYQSVIFATFVHAFADNSGLLIDTGWKRSRKNRPKHGLELGVLAGFAMILVGLGLGVHSVVSWGNVEFGGFDPKQGFRIAIPAVGLMIAGCQTIFASFFHGVLNIERKK